MTIKEYINEYFEKTVSYDWDSGLYNTNEFWASWDRLSDYIDDNGVQWTFDWHQDQPPLSANREIYIAKAVDKYIRKNLRKKYTNGAL